MRAGGQGRADFHLRVLALGEHPEELHDGGGVAVVDDHRTVRLLAGEDLDRAGGERQAVAGLHRWPVALPAGVVRAVRMSSSQAAMKDGVMDAVVDPAGARLSPRGPFADQRALRARQGLARGS